MLYLVLIQTFPDFSYQFDLYIKNSVIQVVFETLLGLPCSQQAVPEASRRIGTGPEYSGQVSKGCACYLTHTTIADTCCLRLLELYKWRCSASRCMHLDRTFSNCTIILQIHFNYFTEPCLPSIKSPIKIPFLTFTQL
jgi:hypothetical protein